MNELYIGLTFICFAIAYRLFKKIEKPTKYEEKQAERYFNKMCEDDGSTEGRICTKGLALVKDNDNKYKFIKQSKLADTSILN